MKEEINKGETNKLKRTCFLIYMIDLKILDNGTNEKYDCLVSFF